MSKLGENDNTKKNPHPRKMSNQTANFTSQTHTQNGMAVGQTLFISPIRTERENKREMKMMKRVVDKKGACETNEFYEYGWMLDVTETKNKYALYKTFKR